MLETIVLVAHITVLGYWLGSEFVINSGYRYVCRSAGMDFTERNRLMDHVLDVDQHVRYALILQIGLGSVLAAFYGFIPGGGTTAALAAGIAVVWLAFIEITHHKREDPTGTKLAAVDRMIRYGVMIGLAVAGGSALMGIGNMPVWLGWKLILFAGVLACGVGIRFSIIDFYRTWAVMKAEGSTPDREARIWFIYTYGTGILIGLWVLIFGIVALSVFKP